jgi:CRISPR-associated helicase Cas3
VITIEGLDLPVYRADGLGFPLYAHQLFVQHNWDSLETALLTAPTASGKTAAAFLPALLRGESVIAAYPTNALLRDQGEAIAALANSVGKSVRIVTPQEIAVPGRSEEIQVIPIDGPGLELGCEALRKRYKGELLNTLLTVSAAPKIVVTNPDVLYLLAAMRYRDSQSGVTRLARYSTLVVDEFHVYSGVELARLLYLIFLLRALGGQVSAGLRRCLLLSATPPDEVMRLLREVFPGLQEITPNCQLPGAFRQCGQRRIMHPVRFHVGLPDQSEQSDLPKRTLEFLTNSRALPNRDSLADKSRTLPLLILLNSVVDARRLEQLLLSNGWTTEELGALRGLMNQADRVWQGKNVVIGTSAAEVGIDFDARQLLFEAEESAAFVQRLSRAGRHAPAEAYLLDSPDAAGAARMRSALVGQGGVLSRPEFMAIVEAVFPSLEKYVKFCSTQYGIFAAASLTDYILDRVASDWGAASDVRDRVQMSLLQVEERYFNSWQASRPAGVPDVSQLHRQTRGYMRLAEEGKTAAFGWMKAYASHFPSFRSQVPQVEVIDKEEQSLGRYGRYRADLRTLAIWAKIGSNHHRESGELVIEVTGFRNEPQRYFVVLKQPHGWQKPWPPEGLFWVSASATDQDDNVPAVLIADSTAGAFPGPFPPGDDPMLALVVTRQQLSAAGFDWRLRAWPLSGRAGTAQTAESKLLLLGDACLVVRALAN